MIAFLIILGLAGLWLVDEALDGPLGRWTDVVFDYLAEPRRIDRELDRQERIRACLAQHPSGKDVA